MRDGFIFYGSFFEALQELDPEDRLAAYDAICSYALTGVEPEGSGTIKAVFKLVRPQIDANNKRRENGKRGADATNEQEGGNMSATSRQPVGNTSATSRQSIGNMSATSRQQVGTGAAKEKEKEKVKEKVKEKEKEKEKEESKSEIIITSCSEPSSEPADVEAIILNDGSEWLPSTADMTEYYRCYPAVDVRQEFANMRGWCLGNPTKRKTRSGVRRFVAAWLAKEQNRSKGRDAPLNRYADIDAWAMEGE